MHTLNNQPVNTHSTNYHRGTRPLEFAGIVNWRLSILPTYWRPPTDVYETEDKYIVRVEIPGMRDGEFSVSVENRILTIRGTRPDSTERRAFHQMEIRFGEFSTEVELPTNADANQILAEYEDGFLRVFLPKATPRVIPIAD
ncbi:MAG: Hsp20/alpha crystallin family protein [Anaerolineaceae bacterium]|nr:Hsp20/alpha crystallin family protein [Anaerolineaceae bacterium]